MVKSIDKLKKETLPSPANLAWFTGYRKCQQLAINVIENIQTRSYKNPMTHCIEIPLEVFNEFVDTINHGLNEVFEKEVSLNSVNTVTTDNENFDFLEKQGFKEIKRIAGEKGSMVGLFLGIRPGRLVGGGYGGDCLFTITTDKTGWAGRTSFLHEVEK